MRTKIAFVVVVACILALAIFLITRHHPRGTTSPSVTKAPPPSEKPVPQPSPLPTFVTAVKNDAATTATAKTLPFLDDEASSIPLWMARIASPRAGAHTYRFYIHGRAQADPGSLHQGKDPLGQPCSTFGYPRVDDGPPFKDSSDGKLVFAWRGRLDYPALVAVSYIGDPWGAIALEPGNAAARENAEEWKSDKNLQTISGKVLDPDEKPAAYAELLVAVYGWGDGSTRVVRAGRADARGAFQMDRLPLVGEYGYLPVYARVANLGFGYARVAPGILQSAEDLEIKLERGVRVAGRVVDGSGKGVGGALVCTFQGNIFSTLCDRDGEFDLDINPTRGMGLLQAYCDGYTPGTSDMIEIKAGEPVRDVRIVLQPGFPVSGRVLDASEGGGNPVAGAWVTGYTMVPGKERRPMGFPISERTDADGAFTIPNAPSSGTLSLRAEKDFLHTKVVKVEMSGGRPESPIELHLPEGMPVRGMVVSPNGKGVEGAKITVRIGRGEERDYTPTDSSGDKRPDIRTDSEGRFAIDALESRKPHSIVATAEGYARGQASQVVPADLFEDVIISLSRGGRISGKVLTRQSREPVSGVQVTLTSYGERRSSNRNVRTAVDGVFSFDELDAGGYFLRGSVEKQGEGEVKSVVLAPEGGIQLAAGQNRDGVELLVVPGLKISGRVVERDSGKAIEEAQVYAYGMGFSSQGNAETDADGRFEIDGLAAGRLVLHASAEGLLPAGDLSQIEVHLSETERPEEVVLKLIRGAGTIEGSVLSADGKPVSGSRVSANPDDDDASTSQYGYYGERPAETDEQGRFKIEKLALNRWYRVVATGERGRLVATSERLRLTKEKPGATVELRGRRGLTVHGKVVDTEGAPVKGASVSLNRDVDYSDPDAVTRSSMHESYYHARTDAKGVWRIEDVTSGTFILHGTLKGYIPDGKTREKKHEIARERTELPDIVLRKGATVRGLIADIGGKPLVGWNVRSERGTHEVQTSYTGTFTLQGAPSSITLSFSPPRHGWQASSMNLTFESERFTVSDEEMGFVIPVVSKVSGRFVSKETGEPVAGVKADLDEGDAEPLRTGKPAVHLELIYGSTQESDSSGRFTISPVPVGRLTLEVEGGGVVKSEREVDILPDKEDIGDIPVTFGATLKARLVDAGGTPLKVKDSSYFSIRVIRAEGKKDYLDSVRPDVESRIEIPGVSLDTEKVEIDSDAYVNAVVDELPELRVGETSDLGDIVMKQGATLLGRIVDARTREPLSIQKTPVDVCARYEGVAEPESFNEEDLGRGKPAGSPEMGRFRIQAVRADATEILFESCGSVFHTLQSPVYDPNGETDLGDIPYPRHRLARGKVVSEDTSVLVKSRMAVLSALKPDGATAMATDCDLGDDGSFKDVLIPEGIAEAMFWCQGFVPATVAIPEPGGDGIDLGAITLRRGNTVRCRIVREGTEQAVKGAIVAQSTEVAFSFKRFPASYSESLPKGVTPDSYTQLGEAPQSSNGRVVDVGSDMIVGGLPAGSVRLLFYADLVKGSWWERPSVETVVEVTPGEVQVVRIEAP